MSSYRWLRVSKGQTILLQWCDLNWSVGGSNSSVDGFRVYKIGFPSRRGKIFAYHSTYVLFVEQSVVSLPLYNGAIQWLVEAEWEAPAISNRSRLKMYVRNRRSLINISHGFASQLHIFQKSDNIFNWVIPYRRYGKPDNLQFMKSWENMQHRLMPY